MADAEAHQVRVADVADVDVVHSQLGEVADEDAHAVKLVILLGGVEREKCQREDEKGGEIFACHDVNPPCDFMDGKIIASGEILGAAR